MNTVVVLTCLSDSHADAVGKYLKNQDVRFVRLNSDEYDSNNEISFNLNNKKKFQVYSHGSLIKTGDIISVWYRKPEYSVFKKRSLSEQLIDQFELKQKLVLFNSYATHLAKQNKFCLNRRTDDRAASDKQFQLITAKKMGFKVPDTLITSSDASIRDFITLHNNTSIIKSIGVPIVEAGDRVRGFFTRELTLDLYKNLVKKTSFTSPVLLQEKIKKKYELRITVVGNKIFPCKIYGDKKLIHDIDIRKIKPETLEHSEYQLPSKIKNLCFELVKKLNLQYAAIDMAVDIEGNYIFFEINPNGQYQWIENLTGMPISQAIADLLANPEKNKL